MRKPVIAPLPVVPPPPLPSKLKPPTSGSCRKEGVHQYSFGQVSNNEFLWLSRQIWIDLQRTLTLITGLGKVPIYVVDTQQLDLKNPVNTLTNLT